MSKAVLKKGDHEELMEKAEDMLSEGIGMTEIMSELGLSKEDILKANRKKDVRKRWLICQHN